MKKSLSFYGYVLALAWALALAGCVSEDYLGDAALANSETEPISFVAGSSAVTRSTLTGAEAAAKLGNNFVVYGTKHSVTENGSALNDNLVFNQYHVSWDENWDYKGNTSYSSLTTDQIVKYWDFGATAGYTFYAFSSRDISYPAQASDPIVIAKTLTGTDAYQKGYALTIKEGADLNNLYFSDRVPVAKANYGQPVQFTFRSFGAKVRVGFYETVPGYRVKIKRFYYDSNAPQAVTDFDDMDVADANNFRAAVQNVKTADVNTFSIVYNALGETKNRPSVVNTTVKYNFDLKLGNNLKDKVLGTTSNTATYDSEGGAFTDILPFEQITNPMLIKCDYVLESEDGQGETYEISGAKAIIPTQYLKWSGNGCYTYLFKITENTSGTTGTPGTDPAGLFDITFDAVCVATDVNDQSNLTTVDRFSITTLRTGMDVYVINTNKTDGSINIPTAIGDESGQAQVYLVSTSDAEIDEVNINAYLMGTQNGISLEPLKFTTGEYAGQFAAELLCYVPATDGSYYTFGDILHPGATHFTSEMGHAYAYVYCKTKHVNPVYSKVAADATWSPTTTYYTYSSGTYTAASGVTEAYFNANKSSLYTMTTPAVAGEYAVMLLDTRGY